MAANTAASASPPVVPLGPTNWLTWRHRIQFLMGAKDMWDVVNEDPPTAPAATDEDEDDAMAAAAAAHQAACASFAKRTQKALCFMGGYVSDMHLGTIARATTAKEAWTALADYYRIRAPSSS